MDGEKGRGKSFIMGVKALPPCGRNGGKCERRKIGCHSTCKEFKEFREAIDGINRELRRKEQSDYTTEGLRKRIIKIER